MPQSLFGIILAVGLVAAGVAIALGYGVHLYSITELTGGTFGSRLLIYHDVDLGLSARYPADFSVNREYLYTGINETKQIRGVSFTVPERKTKGTNLSPDSYVSIEIIANQPSCTASLFLPGSNHSEGITDNGVSYTYAAREEGAAGNRYEEQVYALTRASPCVAVRYFIHSTNIGNYAPGTVKEYDRASLMSVFNTVRHTLSVRQ